MQPGQPPGRDDGRAGSSGDIPAACMPPGQPFDMSGAPTVEPAPVEGVVNSPHTSLLLRRVLGDMVTRSRQLIPLTRWVSRWWMTHPERVRRAISHFGAIEPMGGRWEVDGIGSDPLNVRYHIGWMWHLRDQPPDSYLQGYTGLNTVGNIFEGILGLEWLARKKGQLSDRDMAVQILRYAGDWCTGEMPAVIKLVRLPVGSQLTGWRPVIEALIMGVLFVLQDQAVLFKAITEPEDDYIPSLVQYHLEALRMGHASGWEFYARGMEPPALVGPGHYVTEADPDSYSPISLGIRAGSKGIVESRDTPAAVARWLAAGAIRQPVCRAAASGCPVSHVGTRALLALCDRRVPPPVATRLLDAIPGPPIPKRPTRPPPRFFAEETVTVAEPAGIEHQPGGAANTDEEGSFSRQA